MNITEAYFEQPVIFLEDIGTSVEKGDKGVVVSVQYTTPQSLVVRSKVDNKEYKVTSSQIIGVCGTSVPATLDILETDRTVVLAQDHEQYLAGKRGTVYGYSNSREAALIHFDTKECYVPLSKLYQVM